MGRRMFVAVRPPTEAVEDLEEFLAARPEHPWTSSEQWHLTLSFCADVPERVVDPLTELLAEVAASHPPMSLRLAGAGCFPNPPEAIVLWMRPAGDVEPLVDLAAAVRRACSRAGAVPDGRAFVPHLSVSRLRRPQEQTRWWRVLDTYEGPSWQVEEIELVDSRPAGRRGGRPRHVVEAALSLG